MHFFAGGGGDKTYTCTMFRALVAFQFVGSGAGELVQLEKKRNHVLGWWKRLRNGIKGAKKKFAVIVSASSRKIYGGGREGW